MTIFNLSLDGAYTVLYILVGVMFASLLAHFTVQNNKAPLSNLDFFLLPVIIVLWPVASVFLLMSYVYDYLVSKVTQRKLKKDNEK